MLFLILFGSCEKELFVESSLPETGNYFAALITSNPEGAQIYIDGKYSGHTTPDTINWLTRGEHSVRLRFNSVLDTVFSLNYTQPGLNSVYIDYLAVFNHYGNIYCTAEPSSAFIYLNDVYTARFTPDTIKFLLPGRYKIKYEQFRYRSDSTFVDVVGGRTSTVNLRLQDTTEWLDFRTSNCNIPSDRIVCFKVDPNNAIWIGTYDNGLSKLLNGRFTNFNTSNSPLPSNFITALDIDENNNLWIGTMNGLAKFNGREWEIFNQSQGLPSNYITSIYCNQDGAIYVGTKGGLGLINRGFVTSGTVSGTPLLSKPVSSVTGTKTGILWVASEGGISSYVNDEWKVYTRQSHQLAGIDAGSIAIDAFGAVWCSFPANYSNYGNITGGLMYFDGTNWKEYKLPNTVKGRIQKITADYRGNVWLATPAGVYMLVPEGVYYVFANRAFAMVTPNSMDVLIDRKDKVWFALWEGGVVKCKLKML